MVAIDLRADVLRRLVSKVVTGWTHVIRLEWLFSVGPFYRRDRAQYFPSRDVSADTPAARSQYTAQAYTLIAGGMHALKQNSGQPVVRIPAPGTADEDHNPVRVAPRMLIDLSVSEDRLLKVENISTGIQFSVMNVTNSVAL